MIPSCNGDHACRAATLTYRSSPSTRPVACATPARCRSAGSSCRPRPRAFDVGRGFTLLEILVVIAILAIAAGIAVASLDGDERGTLDREARRFAGALEYAARRAELRHETIGVSAGEGRWRFWLRAADGRWRVLSDDEPLAMRALPATFTAEPISLAGQPLPPEAIVRLRPSGRNEPYAFMLASPAYQAIVAADPLNRVAVTGPQQVPR